MPRSRSASSPRIPTAPPLPTPAAGDLADGTVLRLRLSGFAPDTTGSIRQCTYAQGGFQPCRNGYPVRFDAQGWADAQYQLQAGVLDGSSDCRGAVNPCVVLVEDPAGHSARVITVFSAPVPPAGTVTVEPGGELRAGQEVVLSARGFPTGTSVYAVACDRRRRLPPRRPVGGGRRRRHGPPDRGGVALRCSSGWARTTWTAGRRWSPSSSARSARRTGWVAPAGRWPWPRSCSLARGLGVAVHGLAHAERGGHPGDGRRPPRVTVPASSARRPTRDGTPVPQITSDARGDPTRGEERSGEERWDRAGTC